MIPRTVWVVAHALLVGVNAWLCFGGGMAWLGARMDVSWAAGDVGRRAALLAMGVVLWGRMTYAAYGLLRRRFGWSELFPVVGACAVYQVGFALLGAAEPKPLGAADGAGLGLFVLGSLINTLSEVQRRRFKSDPANQGKLYTGGLFRLARHINYTGDALWVTGWAIVTANLWAAAVPVLLTIGFVAYFIPVLSTYLRKRYGRQYDQWARHTKAFIPFVY